MPKEQDPLYLGGPSRRPKPKFRQPENFRPVSDNIPAGVALPGVFRTVEQKLEGTNVRLPHNFHRTRR